jgi:hypothetical protein
MVQLVITVVPSLFAQAIVTFATIAVIVWDVARHLTSDFKTG